MAQKSDYELTEAEAALLTGVTKDALAAAGSRSPGGSLGGRLGARFTKPHTFETTVEVRQAPDTVREHARTAIAEDGTALEDPNGAEDSSVWGMVASGAMNMVPALVRVAVIAPPEGNGASHVHVRATGNEGLIKQKVGAKAADRIAAAISEKCTP